MSGLRLMETFNRLVKGQFTQHLKKGAVALALTTALAAPVAAHHNDNNDLDVRQSNTIHSQDLRTIQDRFNRAVTDREILLMDHDWIQINRAVSDVREDLDFRDRYLIEYLSRRGRVHINNEFFYPVSDDYLKAPHAQFVNIAPADGGKDFKLCIVYGEQGEKDGKTAIKNFMDLSRTIHGPDIGTATIQNVPNAAHWKKFISYHEIGHCMDDWYMPSITKAENTKEYLASYHRAETFADVYSVLLMAREEGITDIARSMTNVRLAIAALSGPFQTTWKDPDKIGYHAGYIYATQRSIRATQDYIDRNGTKDLYEMSYKDIAKMAHDIVDKNALNNLEAETLMSMFFMKYNMDIWEKMKDDVPFITEHYPYALELQAKMERALRSVLDLSHIPEDQSVLELLTFPGSPDAYAQERRGEVDYEGLDARAKTLAKTLASQSPTVEILIKTFTENKDAWRKTLSNGTDAEKKEAMDNLTVAGEALRLAVHEIRGTDPYAPPPNDNQPIGKQAQLNLPTVAPR